ncbi:EPIDERMAL PATTERNING FACTOR-like protein 9 [Citrus sinensis]|uniref:Stomagen C-terminal domain-containing protein n=1 Tax=Citrus clementina TaxID=85681 RepID=V4VDI0_CITCL|nr:EPIDERMAL PATTERNING FACTOR-like protein 9 [Citrus x clementina]XP_006484825.1 EPIDERMAL PATTERNING FACTOR-like protein 9 [Citrus sinensis]ESR50459.1 hypothetical protein CICLE_v10033128mg [Citrus x clementina]KAH9706306.1 EPIDERMAL PATTERNING FACTOR-like protein 9 [Citrus sinensis]
MASIKLCNFVLLLLLVQLLAPAYVVVQGSRTQVGIPRHQSFSPSSPVHFKESSKAKVMNRNSRRLMIGSTAPTCTYNECRGCKYKCRAEQVPVEGNDPINSAYHYKCVCHR